MLEIDSARECFFDWYRSLDSRGARDSGLSDGEWTVNCYRAVNDDALFQICQRIEVLGAFRLMLHKSSVTDESIQRVWTLNGIRGVALGRSASDRGLEELDRATRCYQLYFEKSRITVQFSTQLF
jgi:hypothetical protein